MKILIHIALFFCCFTVVAQKNLKNISLKKGEVLDIIMLTTVPDPAVAFERYKKTAFPVAFEYSYEPQPGFNIAKRYLGSTSPAQFLFGKWENIKKRKGFIADITARVPDFHQQRNELFSHFSLLYFEMEEDTSFAINTDKINMVTSFWEDVKNTPSGFISTWKKEVRNYGGTVCVKLANGTSPVGYSYNPDVVIITQWDTQSGLDTFIEAHPLNYYGGLTNIEQFVIK